MTIVFDRVLKLAVEGDFLKVSKASIPVGSLVSDVAWIAVGLRFLGGWRSVCGRRAAAGQLKTVSGGQRLAAGQQAAPYKKVKSKFQSSQDDGLA